MQWIDKRLILALHDRQIAEHGGASGLRDETLLESAIARPQQHFAYGSPPPDLAALAASLAYGLARNHAFVDGNKRTAFVTCLTLVALNGGELVASTEDKYLTFLALGEGRLNETKLAGWLRAHMPPGNDDSIHEPRARYGRSKPCS